MSNMVFLPEGLSLLAGMAGESRNHCRAIYQGGGVGELTMRTV
jgi:hypothetical protein